MSDVRRRLLGVDRGDADAIRPPSDVWDRAAEARFALARSGIQAHLVDLLIALTASSTGHALLTRDRDFTAIAQAVPVDLELF